ncbi:MAG TPA: nuclear transport factor 2 family protein [Terriglobales bacterium]|nr:nuclear transport factor 2 family protein [Terriglobales bacterium]
MKTTLAVCVLTLAAVSCRAQAAPESRVAEEAAIRKAALNYVEGWYEANGDRMQSAVHPELAKRIARNDPTTGRTTLQSLSADQLVQYTRQGGGKTTPPDKQMKDVKVLDIFQNAATVRAEMAGWVDYMHLAKIDGEWKIVNVLWATKPKK